jgi:hypothetical protein
LAASAVQRVEVAASAHALVVLQRQAERTLRLQLDGGAGVAGAKVELVRPCLGEVALEGYVVDLSDWDVTSVPEKALLLATATTGADGTLALRGPAATPLALRVLGPGCLPFVVRIDRLDGLGELVVTARGGGAVQVTASPAALLAELAAVHGASPDDPPPHVWLERPLARGRERVPPRDVPGETFGTDGVATLRGVPEGTWTPWLAFANESIALAPVSVTAGATAVARVELPAPATLRGRVTLDGAPASSRRALVERLRGERERHAGRWVAVGSRGVALDADGAFVLRTLPGAVRVLLQHTDRTDRNEALASPASVELAAGAVAEHTFTVTLATAALRFVDAQQRPVAGVSAWLTRADGYHIGGLRPSDADGRTRLDGVEAAVLRVVTLPRRFGDYSLAIPKLYADHPDDPAIVERTRIDLGAVALRGGEPVEHTLVLPDAWFR